MHVRTDLGGEDVREQVVLGRLGGVVCTSG